MALRADDGSFLEAKEPEVILGPENSEFSESRSKNGPEIHRPFDSARNPYGFGSVHTRSMDLGKWGFWLAPLAILALSLFLIFGTFFIAVLVGIVILVTFCRKLARVFFGT